MRLWIVDIQLLWSVKKLQHQVNQWNCLTIIYALMSVIKNILCYFSISAQLWAQGSISCLASFPCLPMQIQKRAGCLLRHTISPKPLSTFLCLQRIQSLALCEWLFLWVLCQYLSSWAKLRSIKCWVVPAEQVALKTGRDLLHSKFSDM